MEAEHKTRILVIEDDARLRTALGQLLEGEGFEVMEAEEGEDGLSQFRARPADLVVTDLIMPGKEGMETILELRREYPDLKIIAISGGGRVRAAEYLPVAAAAGADKTLAKPFSFVRLLQIITELLPPPESDPL
jgi:DNA-binding response OmpR family regulator